MWRKESQQIGLLPIPGLAVLRTIDSEGEELVPGLTLEESKSSTESPQKSISESTSIKVADAPFVSEQQEPGSGSL